MDARKIRQELGWAPQETFATGLRSVVHGAPEPIAWAIAALTVLCVGVLRWPLIPVVLCLAPLSIGLAWMQLMRR